MSVKGVKVSIIMNCYNSSKFLKEALDSVILQTYSNWELIFWDNKSTDESATIFKGYQDERFKYHLALQNTDLSEARNLAIEKAEGDWLAFLDCDDVWKSTKLELQVSSITDSVGVVYSPFDIILNTNQKHNSLLNFLTKKITCEPHGPRSIYNKLLESNFIIFSSVLLKKSLFAKTGGFSNNLVHNEDYEILLKSCFEFQAVCINEKAVGYRIHDTNNSYANSEISYVENNFIYHQLPPTKELSKAINNNKTRFAFHKIRNGFYKSGIIYFIKYGSFQSVIAIIIRRVFIMFNNLVKIILIAS